MEPIQKDIHQKKSQQEPKSVSMSCGSLFTERMIFSQKVERKSEPELEWWTYLVD